MRNRIVVLLSALIIFLSACGRSPTQPAGEPPSYTHALTVAITAHDTRDELEARYRATVVVWEPGAGFAILGLEGAPETLGPLSSNAEQNRSVITAPEVGAAGWPMWAGGWQMWAGGWQMWAGGWQMWAGGQGNSFTPTENHAHWHQIGLFDAHALAPNRGAGVTVAVIDSGLDLHHPIFQGYLTSKKTWFDFVDFDLIPQDERGALAEPYGYGHGTGMAGIVRQVAPQARIMPIRVLRPDGSGELLAVVAAIYHAVERGADVINLSLGTTRPSLALRTIIDYANKRGVIVIASSGNTGDTAITFPAAYAASQFTLSVGSVDPADTKSDFSTYGARLDVLAPGRQVFTSAPGERVAGWTGTSISTAVVTGAVALALSETSDRGSLVPLMKGTAFNIDHLNQEYQGQLGHGRIRVDAFLRSATGR
jgi:thermitase